MDARGSLRIIGNDRAWFDEQISETEINSLAGNADITVLQCSTPVPDTTWKLLNSAFFAARPDVELRIYGHYGEECDLGVGRFLENVRHVSADCLMNARNVESVAEIPHLESLSVDIFELQDFHFLNRVSPALTALSLGPTRSKRPGLDLLQRFPGLKRLGIEGQNKGIEVLSGLTALEDVLLRSVTTPNLRYLEPHKNLWSLNIKLGGIRSFAGIESKKSLKYLELWQIRELSDIGVIATLEGLQNLFLQSLPHIAAFPSVVNAKGLRRVFLENLKKMNDFGALEQSPALEEFSLTDGRGQDPEQPLPVLRNPNVRRLKALFGTDRKNRSFATLRDKYGKTDLGPWHPFEYR